MSALILRSKDCATHWAIQRRNPATSRPCRGAATASSPLWRTAQNKGHLRHRVPPNPPQNCTPLWKPWTPQGPPHRRRPPPALVEPGLVGCYPDWEFWWCCSLRSCALRTPPRFRPPALGARGLAAVAPIGPRRFGGQNVAVVSRALPGGRRGGRARDRKFHGIRATLLARSVPPRGITP